MPLPNRTGPAGETGPVPNTLAVGALGVDLILNQTSDIESACAAYVVLLLTPAGKYRRRVFLSLHSATAAVQRAQAKGQPVRLVLCRLVPLPASEDLEGGTVAS
jgi:hypothetical protein